MTCEVLRRYLKPPSLAVTQNNRKYKLAQESIKCEIQSNLHPWFHNKVNLRFPQSATGIMFRSSELRNGKQMEMEVWWCGDAQKKCGKRVCQWLGIGRTICWVFLRALSVFKFGKKGFGTDSRYWGKTRRLAPASRIHHQWKHNLLLQSFSFEIFIWNILLGFFRFGTGPGIQGMTRQMASARRIHHQCKQHTGHGWDGTNCGYWCNHRSKGSLTILFYIFIWNIWGASLLAVDKWQRKKKRQREGSSILPSSI